MKKITILLLAFLILCLCGCSDEYEKTVIDDVTEYETVRDLPEHRIAERSKLFPSNIADKKVNEFYCEHITALPVGTEWQMVLEIEYNAEEYNTELTRIQKLCENSPVCGKTDYFSNTAYATVWNWNGCYEYIVLDDANYTATYLYLQLKNKEDISIHKSLLPNDYDLEMGDVVFSIYD